MDINLNVRHIQKHDTFEGWQINNTVLLEGEMGYDTTNKIIKLGDGITGWNNLESINTGGTAIAGFEILPFTILSTAWIASVEYSNYPFQTDINVEGITENSIAELKFNIDSLFNAIESEVFTNGVPLNGKIRMFTAYKPSANLQGVIIIFKKS